MAYSTQFGLFQDAEDGPVWREFFTDLAEAKAQAQIIADGEGVAFILYDLKDSKEVARFYPSKA